MVACSTVQEPRLLKSINRILSTTFERIQIQQTFRQYFMQTEQKKRYIFSGHGTILYTVDKSADDRHVTKRIHMKHSNQFPLILKTIERDCTRQCNRRYCITY